MKRLAITAIVGLSLSLAANADALFELHETFASGAVFDGAIAFTNDYRNLAAVDGWLTGGGWGSQHFTGFLSPTSDFAQEYGLSMAGISS